MAAFLQVAMQEHFVYDQSVPYRQTMSTRPKTQDGAPTIDEGVSRVAAAIGDPSRALMLCSLLDGHARTSIELATIAEITPSTASVHLARLTGENLLRVVKQGKHRYYALNGPDVGIAMENLLVLSGVSTQKFAPNTPRRLQAARTCYDHMAGVLGVAFHNAMFKQGWLAEDESREGRYIVTPAGQKALEDLGIDLASAKASRRRFAFGCMDWSERCPHLGGALGASVLALALKRKWVSRELDSRALAVTAKGIREMRQYFGFAFDPKS
jgi:DNA-binding transcriptional ArsR family regulator